MTNINHTQDYQNFKLLISESSDGNSFIKENNDTVTQFLGKIKSDDFNSFESLCKMLFQYDDDKIIDEKEQMLLDWLKDIQQDKTRLEALEKEIENSPIY